LKRRHLEQLIADCVDSGESDARKRAEDALRAVPESEGLLAEHRRIHSLFGELDAPTLERSVAREVLAELRKQPHGRQGSVPVFFWAGVGTAAIAVVLAVGLLLRTSGPQSPGAYGPLRPGVARSQATKPAEPLSSALCAREHARLASGYATTDRAAWAVALVESNRQLLR
jgi:hypothetical protein